jgi:hypothetical protein
LNESRGPTAQRDFLSQGGAIEELPNVHGITLKKELSIVVGLMREPLAKMIDLPSQRYHPRSLSQSR